MFLSCTQYATNCVIFSNSLCVYDSRYRSDQSEHYMLVAISIFQKTVTFLQIQCMYLNTAIKWIHNFGTYSDDFANIEQTR